MALGKVDSETNGKIFSFCTEVSEMDCFNPAENRFRLRDTLHTLYLHGKTVFDGRVYVMHRKADMVERSGWSRSNFTKAVETLVNARVVEAVDNTPQGFVGVYLPDPGFRLA